MSDRVRRVDEVDGVDRVDDIRARLDAIAEELADLSMEALRQAIDDGAQKRPPSEKAYSQARRAVEKASRLLDGIDGG